MASARWPSRSGEGVYPTANVEIATPVAHFLPAVTPAIVE
jgi:hypothetical protein